MTKYTVESIFRAKGGRVLSRKTTFDDEADDARRALIEAHKAMKTVVAANPLVDSIASNVRGSDGSEVNTTDWADELDILSHSGLMCEMDAQYLDERAGMPVAEALDAVLTDEQKDALVAGSKPKFGEGITVDALSPGGGAPARPADGFPRTGQHTSRSGMGGASYGPDRDSANSHGSGTVESDERLVQPSHPGRDAVSGAGGVAGRAGQRKHKGANPSGGTPWARQGQRYGGSDILKDIRDAQYDFEHRTNKKPEAIHLSPEAWKQLRKRMESDGHLTRAQSLEGGHLHGLPIYRNLNDGAPSIQIGVKNKRNPNFSWRDLPSISGGDDLPSVWKQLTRTLRDLAKPNRFIQEYLGKKTDE